MDNPHHPDVIQKQDEQVIYSKTIFDEEMGVNLFQFCPKLYAYSDIIMPRNSLCRLNDNTYILYYNLSQVSHHAEILDFWKT